MRQDSLVRTRYIAAMAAAVMMLLGACRGRTPEPTPPEPKPEPTTPPKELMWVMRSAELRPVIVRDEDGNATLVDKPLSIGDRATLFGYVEGKATETQVLSYVDQSGFVTTTKAKPRLPKGTAVAVLLNGELKRAYFEGFGKYEKIDLEQGTYTPGYNDSKLPAKDGWMVVPEYIDHALGCVDLVGRDIKAQQGTFEVTMQSPFAQLELTIANGEYPQHTSEVGVIINGIIWHEATYHFTTGRWSGAEGRLYAGVNDENKVWGSREAKKLLLPIPLVTAEGAKEREVTITLTTKDAKGREAKRELTTTLTLGKLTTIEMMLPEQEAEDDGTPLSFTPLVNDSYWRNANAQWTAEIKAHLVKLEDTPETREMYQTATNIGMQHQMRNRTLYREEPNLIVFSSADNVFKYETDFNRADRFAVGLEDMNGNLIEVYPAQYCTDLARKLYPYSYVTVPSGEYRIAMFYQRAAIYEDHNWYQLPELNGVHPGWVTREDLPIKENGYYQTDTWRGKMFNEPIPPEESPEHGMNRVTVVDRTESKVVAPVWTDVKINGVVNRDVNYNLTGGHHVEATLHNRSNKAIKGKVVWKYDDLSFYSDAPLARDLMMHWYNNHKDIPRPDGVSILYPFESWSREFEAQPAIIEANGTIKVNFVVPQDWRKQGMPVRMEGGARLTLYWRDENGKETMLHQGFHELMNAMERENLGSLSAKYFGVTGFEDDDDWSLSFWRLTPNKPLAYRVYNCLTGL